MELWLGETLTASSQVSLGDRGPWRLPLLPGWTLKCISITSVWVVLLRLLSSHGLATALRESCEAVAVYQAFLLPNQCQGGHKHRHTRLTTVTLPEPWQANNSLPASAC